MPGSRNSTPIMFNYVYVLESVNNSEFYIGYTTDLRKRLQEHNRGVNFSTKPRKPWELIHYEAYRNEKDAKRRENYLKTNQGARVLSRIFTTWYAR